MSQIQSRRAFLTGGLAESEPEKVAADPDLPWKAAVSEACLAQSGVQCRACEDFCEPRALRFRLALGGRATPQIDLETCTGCGACVEPCPSGAISLFQPPPQTQPQTESLSC